MNEIMFNTNNPALNGSNFADIARLEAMKQNNLKKVLIDKLLDAIFGENAPDNTHLRKEDFMGTDWNDKEEQKNGYGRQASKQNRLSSRV